MSDWYQDQIKRTNDGGAAMMLREREEQRRREEERRRQEEERRRREEEERRRRDEEKRRRDEEQQKQWNEQRKQWSQNSSSYESCSYGSSYSSDAAVVPWSSLNWFEKLLSIPWIMLNLLLFFVIRIPCTLFLLGILESVVRGMFLSDGDLQTPESLITYQIMNYYLLFLKVVYDMVAPVIQQFLESAYQLVQSFLDGYNSI